MSDMSIVLFATMMPLYAIGAILTMVECDRRVMSGRLAPGLAILTSMFWIITVPMRMLRFVTRRQWRHQDHIPRARIL